MKKYIIQTKKRGKIPLPPEIIGIFNDALYVVPAQNSGLQLMTTKEFDILREKMMGLPDDKLLLLRPLLARTIKCLIHKGKIQIPSGIMALIASNDEKVFVLVNNDDKYYLYGYNAAAALFKEL
jgi:DNA-binding transcriptional regulator/RsmH inhibitor MraZ